MKNITATDTNIFSLVKHMKGADVASNRCHATSRPHLVRCIKAGLVEVVGGKELHLTEAGKAAIEAYHASWNYTRLECWKTPPAPNLEARK